MSAQKRGFWCVAVGGEGSGKSSQMRLLRDKLVALGHDVVLTREPGGSPSAEMIRELVLTGDKGRFCGMSEILLFAAARVEHMRQLVIPALEAGKVVLQDRGYPCTVSYQGYGRGEDLRLIKSLHRNTVGSMMGSDRTEPDLTLLFDVEPKIGLSRSTKRLANERSKEGRFEAEELAFHERVREGYQGQRQASNRWETIDAGADMATVEAQVWECVSRRSRL